MIFAALTFAITLVVYTPNFYQFYQLKYDRKIKEKEKYC
jgi:hypothetical protein